MSFDAPDTRKILSTTPSDKDHTVLLEIVPLSLDVRLQRLAVRQLDTRNFTFRRVGFLRFGDEYLGADALFLWRIVEKW